MEHNPKIYSFDNGMQILSLQDDNSHSISIYFYIKVGSKDEPPHLNGISHFIEHMVWKGTPNFKNPLAITRYLDSLGASYNAFVNKYLTAYHYKFPSNLQSLDKICKINNEMLFKAIMREKDIQVERNVILEELKSDLNDPDKYFDDQLEKKIFKDHPLGLVVGGEIDTVKKMKRNELIKYYKEKYTKDNIFIAIVGKLPSGYLKTIKKYFLSEKDKQINNSIKIQLGGGIRSLEDMDLNGLDVNSVDSEADDTMYAELMGKDVDEPDNAMIVNAYQDGGEIGYAINILMTWNPEKSQELFDFFVVWLQDREIHGE